MGDVTRLSALAMAELVRRREISPIALIEAHLARIEKLNPKLNAFVHVEKERARRDARAAAWAVQQGVCLEGINGVPLSFMCSIYRAALCSEVATDIRT